MNNIKEFYYLLTETKPKKVLFYISFVGILTTPISYFVAWGSLSLALPFYILLGFLAFLALCKKFSFFSIKPKTKVVNILIEIFELSLVLGGSLTLYLYQGFVPALSSGIYESVLLPISIAFLLLAILSGVGIIILNLSFFQEVRHFVIFEGIVVFILFLFFSGFLMLIWKNHPYNHNFCSNEKYQTSKREYFNSPFDYLDLDSNYYVVDDSRITRKLTYSSTKKLKNVVSEKGSGVLLRELKGLSHCLETLDLSGTGISNTNGLSELTVLEELNLSYNSNLSDIAALSELKDLEKLELKGTSVSNVSSLANLSKLKNLDLTATNVSDTSSLSELDGLRVLTLRHTPISDISSLSGFKNLRYLNLQSTSVSDLSSLAELNKLETIRLEGTNVHNLSPLKDINYLEEVYVNKELKDQCEEMERIKKDLHCTYLNNGTYGD